MFVLGTAGHIDHGKSRLVLALTGMDPDRLREEKERGMTIDLGFAWFKLPSGREVGIVDVPGHERFIKNMLAGVGGIDLALLVVAANEGVMPQTREHLAILDLLEIRRGIVVITKKDMVDDEWLALVRMEIEELLAPTTLAKAPIFAVSVITGEGMPALVAAIDELLGTTEPRKDLGRPRLPIDRIFTTAGAGTIVTGTLIDGSLTVGQEVAIVPVGVKSRLRGLQTHKAALTTATPGSRVAANLVGVATAQLQRGDVLTRPGLLTPTTLVTARLHLLAYLHHLLKHDAIVSFHTGAAEVMAKVSLLETEKLAPGQAGWVQLFLEKPVAVVNGDHFIIRSPDETLGGGRIIEAHARRLRRFRAAIIQNLRMREEGTAEEAILALLVTKQPADSADFTASLMVNDAQAALDGLIRQGQIVAVGQDEHRLLFTQEGWEKLSQKAVSVVQDYHRKFPTRAGIPKVELTSRLKLGTHFAAALQKLTEVGLLVDEGTTVRLVSYRIQLTPAQQTKVDAFLRALDQNPYAPPTDLIPEPELVNLLAEQHRVVKLSEAVVVSTAAYDAMLAKVTARLKAQGKITLAEVRDMFQTSRKYAQAFLEHLDEKRITRRVGDERVMW